MKIKLDSAIQLLHKASYGVLATRSTQMPGYPFASILPFVLNERHSPVFYISGLAEHTKNLTTDHRASFLVSSPDGQSVLKSARVTLIGDAQQFEASPELITRYLHYQPDAKQYLNLGDFAFFRLIPKRVRYIAGFGEMGWIEELDWHNAAALPLMNEQRTYKDVIELLPINVRLLGMDCYGFDIEHDGKRERHQFPNAPIGKESLVEVVKRFLAAL
jgi:hypothetical protein